MKLFNILILIITAYSLFAQQYRPLPVDKSGKLSPSSKFVSANGIVQVESTGNLAYPDKATFFNKNIKVFQQDFRIYIDTTQSISNNNINGVNWWTDCEIKGVDKWNNLIYFTSSNALNNNQVAALHPTITDKTLKIFFWKAVGSNSTGGCWGEKLELENFKSSIGAMVRGYAVSAIWFYPSLDSTECRAVPVYKGAGILDTDNYPRQGDGNNTSATNLRAGYRWVIWGEYIREIFNNPDNTFISWRQTINAGEYYNGNKLWRPVRLEYYGEFKEVK